MTNSSLTIAWRQPNNLNGPSTLYRIFKNNDVNPWNTTDKLEVITISFFKSTTMLHNVIILLNCRLLLKWLVIRNTSSLCRRAIAQWIYLCVRVNLIPSQLRHILEVCDHWRDWLAHFLLNVFFLQCQALRDSLPSKVQQTVPLLSTSNGIHLLSWLALPTCPSLTSPVMTTNSILTQPVRSTSRKNKKATF